MKRWTINELDSISDIDFAIAILNERKDTLINPYSPIASKLNHAIATLYELRDAAANKED